MSTIKCYRDASFAFFFIAFLMLIVSYVSPFWVEESSNNVWVTFGLWNKCVFNFNYYGGYDDWECDFIGNLGWSWRTLSFFAMTVNFVSFILYCVWMCKDKNYLRRKGAGPIGNAALYMSLIGVCLFMPVTIKFAIDVDLDSLFWAYWLAWSGIVMNFMNSVVTLGTTYCCYDTSSVAPLPPRTTTTTAVDNRTTQGPMIHPPTEGISGPAFRVVLEPYQELPHQPSAVRDKEHDLSYHMQTALNNPNSRNVWIE